MSVSLDSVIESTCCDSFLDSAAFVAAAFAVHRVGDALSGGHGLPGLVGLVLVLLVELDPVHRQENVTLLEAGMRGPAVGDHPRDAHLTRLLVLVQLDTDPSLGLQLCGHRVETRLGVHRTLVAVSGDGNAGGDETDRQRQDPQILLHSQPPAVSEVASSAASVRSAPLTFIRTVTVDLASREVQEFRVKTCLSCNQDVTRRDLAEGPLV